MNSRNIYSPSRTITIAHTPDADDAFMFYGLTSGKIKSDNFEILHELKSIQELNKAAQLGTYEMSALSFAAYPSVADRYMLMPCGACMGFKHGPMILSKRDLTIADLAIVGATPCCEATLRVAAARQVKIAIPGRLTTAYLLLKMLAPDAVTVEMPFDQIVEAVINDQVDAGLIIHEAQMTYEQSGLKKIVDLGMWWYEQTELPLPLGGNVIRRDLGEPIITEMITLFQESIKYALTNRAEAVNYALRYARGMPADQATVFIGRYVNELTVDYGEVGKRALQELFRRTGNASILPPSFDRIILNQ